MQETQRVGGEDASTSTDALESVLDVLVGVLGPRGRDDESAVDARPQGAVDASFKALPQLGETDQDERQQRLLVPLVVGEDVQVTQDGVEQKVRLIEQEEWMHALSCEFFDVRRKGVKHGSGGGLARDAQRETQLPVEVTAAERGVAAVGQAKACLRQLGA